MGSRAAILRAAAASGAPAAAQATYPPQGGSPWIGQLPSYSTDPGSGYSYAYGPFLPRPQQTFTQGAFGPFSPILPVPVDQPPPGLPRAQPRRWQYEVGYNLPVGQPGSEGYKLASFQTLKTLADTYSILRTCLEIRKNEIRALDWDIVLTPDAAKAYQGDRVAMRDFGERRAKALKWFRKPDPNYFTFNSWLHAFMDQVFTIDAASLYMCPKKARGMGRGLLGTDLDCLWLIDGSSIRPLVGLHGEKPAPAAPAYEQYEYGVPRSDYTMMIDGRDLDESGLSEADLRARLRGDQLLYLPYLERTESPYGFSLVEQALVPIMTGLRKQAYQLDFFNENTTPRVYISPGDTTMTPNQIRELQDALNSVAGDIAWNFKVQVLPPGSKVMPQKDMEIVDQADEWIATEVCMVANINPMEVGILPKISTVASPFAAREMAQAQRSIHERTATKPTLKYVTEIFDVILQVVCRQDDMRFIFSGMDETQDQAALTDMGIKQVQSGVRSIDEVRDDLHLPPWGLPETSGPIVVTQMGPIPLGEAAADTVSQLRQAVTGAHDAAAGHQGASSGRKPVPAGTSGTGRMNGPVTQRQARRGGALAPAHATGEGAPGHSGGKPVPKAAMAELEALARHLGKGMHISEWVPVHLPGHVLGLIAEDLDAGIAPAEAVKSAAALLPKAAPQSQSAQQRQQAALAAQYQAQITAAFGVALTAAAGLIAAWIAGTLAVTAMVLAQMIAEEIRKALLAALTALWKAAWDAGANHEGHGGAKAARKALEAFLATEGENWAQLISGTGITALLAAIREALAAGDPQAVIALLEQILKVDQRSEQIAVSEVTRAWNAGVWAVLKAAGVAYKQWNTRNDSRVCGTCAANQAQGPVPLDKPFRSGAMMPLQHPNCRCWLTPWTPPKSPAASKVLRREVDLNGQETWHDYDEPHNAAGGGGRVFQPRRDVQDVPAGGVPGASAGGEPPRWDGSEPVPMTERAPDADDSAGYGAAEGTGARPGTYWPAPYMDGWWPSPHGHGTGQAPASSPGAENGRPPNSVGKTARVSAGLKGKTVPARKVYQQMLGNFPPKAIRWVLGATWKLADVPMELVDRADEDKWAASRQPAHVQEFVRLYESGGKVAPPVLVDEPGHLHLVVVDGHHRTKARQKMGRPVRAYVGTVAKRGGPWLRTYQHQEHSGDSPQNKSFTAGNIAAAGNVHGLTPFNLQGAPNAGAYCAGLAVRAADTGRVLMIQRAITDDDPAAGLWELPGGHAEDGETLLQAAIREWEEEVGRRLPAGEMTGAWDASNGIYEGFVLTIPHEDDVDLAGPCAVDNPDGDSWEAVAWWDPGLIDGSRAFRPEMLADLGLFRQALGTDTSKSARTPMLEVTPRILGPHGLWHTPDRHVGHRQKLPDYIEQVAGALMDQQGMEESQAIATAINAIKRWARGDLHWGHGKVTPEVIAASQRALAQWESLRASHHG